MFYLKGCTKCQGDLTLEKDTYGDFLKCMQCGTLIEVHVEVYGHQSLMSKSGANALSKAKAETEAVA